jgi:dephospho-CoA kinase
VPIDLPQNRGTRKWGILLGMWKHGRNKPVIGVIGGIGSGKSAVGRMFAREGCVVIDSDKLAHEVIEMPVVREELRGWLGDGVFDGKGRVDRKAVGGAVFGDEEKVKRLNGMIHPRIGEMRLGLMAKYLADRGVKAIVWDTPLLVETGLDRECDVVVFVDAAEPIRLERVRKSRGWGAEEVKKREKSQIGLDKKAQVADYCIDNGGDEAASLLQVQRVLSHLFSMIQP